MNKFAKILGVSVLSASILAACGTEENTVSTAGEDNGEQQEQEESQEQEQEEAAEASIDVKSENFGARKDSIDNVYAYYAAEIPIQVISRPGLGMYRLTLRAQTKPLSVQFRW